MKFRVDRDVLADAVAWAAASLPTRPLDAGARRVLRRGQRDGELPALRLRLRGQPRVEVNADVAAGRGPGLRPAARRDRRSLPDRPVDVSAEGGKVVADLRQRAFTLLTMPVEDYPRLPELPTPSGRSSGDVFAAAVSQVAVAAGRDDTLPVLTGVLMEIEGRLVTLRPPTATASRSASSPGRPSSPTCRPPPWSRPARSPTPPSRSSAGAEVTIALASPARCGRGPARLRGRRPVARPGVRRPGCSTASSPSSARCSRPSARSVARVDTARSSSRSSGSRWSPSATRRSG